MRSVRAIMAGLFLAALAGGLPGCHLLHHKQQPAQAPAPLPAACTSPASELDEPIGPCWELNPLVPGRRITLWETIDEALKNGRVGDDNIRVKTYDVAQALDQAKRARTQWVLQCERIWLILEAGTQDLVAAAEGAYWNLVLARANLVAREEAYQALEEEATTVRARYKEKLLARQDVDAIEEQVQLAKAELLDAQARVLEAERTLRRTAGLPPYDGCALVPGDEPDRTPPVCDPQADLAAARDHLPELARARVELELACRALSAVVDDKERPSARMKVERDRAALRDIEQQAVFALQAAQRRVVQTWETLGIMTAREEAARRRLEAVLEKWQSKEFGEVRELLQARTALTAARSETTRALIEVQQARVEHLRRKGLLLKYHCVNIERRPPRPTSGDD